MTEPHEKRELETIAPEGILDSITTTIKNLATWPFHQSKGKRLLCGKK